MHRILGSLATGLGVAWPENLLSLLQVRYTQQHHDVTVSTAAVPHCMPAAQVLNALVNVNIGTLFSFGCIVNWNFDTWSGTLMRTPQRTPVHSTRHALFVCGQLR